MGEVGVPNDDPPLARFDLLGRGHDELERSDPAQLLGADAAGELDIDLSLTMGARAQETTSEARPAGLHVPLGSRLDEAERSLIEVTLDYCEGDKRRAAAVLGCSLKTLYNKLNSYARSNAEAKVRAPIHAVGGPLTGAPI